MTNLHNLQKEAKALRMTAEEKSALHATLMRAMDKSALSAPSAAPRPQKSIYYFLSPQLAGAFAAFLIVVVGGSTAYAAGGALPGDALYTVKTKINEPLAGALAFSVEDKIKFHTQVAQTRIEEAEVLASQDRLDASTTATLESNIDAHLNERATLAAALEEKKPGSSLSIAARLDSSISAHGEVLAQLGAESASSTVRENSDSLASRVRWSSRWSTGATLALASAKAVANETMAPQAMSMTLSVAEDTANVAAEASTSEISNDNKKDDKRRDDSHDKKEALSLSKQASSTLNDLTRAVLALKGKVDEDTQAKLDSRLSKIVRLIAAGNTQVEDEEYDDAKESFEEALDKGVTLETFIEANARFDSGILTHLLGNDSDSGDDR